MRLKQDLWVYKLTLNGRRVLHGLSPVESPCVYSCGNARRVLLELLDDVEDGGDSSRERFEGFFVGRVPDSALRFAARALRERGLVEPYERALV